MSLIIADRVRETTTTSGNGDIYLGGAVVGFVPFSAVLSNGSTTFYAIIATAGGQWEVGVGTYSEVTNSLARTTVLSSSSSGAKVVFTSGTKNVVMTQPAERTLYVDGAAIVVPNNAVLSNANLANSSLTINGITVSLGGAATVTAVAPYALTLGTGLTGTSYDGSSAVTATIDNTVVTLTGTQTLINKTLDAGTLVTANSAADALKITQTGAGNALVVEDTASPDPSPFVITANGSLVAGYTSTLNAGGANNPKLEVLGTTDSLSTIAAGRWSADTSPSSLYTMKSRNAVIGSSTIVQSGDQIGQVVFTADDGVTFTPAASIVAEVDGTPGASDMPGRLVFKTTADGAATSTTAMTINNAQQVGVGPAPVANKGTFQVGTIGYTDTGIVGGFASSVAGYNQIIFQNTSNNAAASANLNVSNDAATATTNYGELGINSSAFTGSGSFNTAGYVYLASASTDLAIGTYGANAVHFTVNSGATDAGSISSAGRWAINNSSTNTTATALLHLGAGTATASTAPLKLTAGTNLTTAEAGAVEYDGTVFYADTRASTRTTMVSEQLVVLNTAYTLTSQTAAQKLFNTATAGAVTLPVGTHFFECFFSLSAMSATSGSFGFALAGGTGPATFTQTWWAEAQKGTATLATATATQSTYNTAANTTLATASVNTVGYAIIKGTINVTVAGTIVPQVSLGVAAAAVVGVGSFFKVYAASPTSGATTFNVGNWS